MNLLFPDWLAYLFVFAVGGCVGSFLNVVIYRIPKGKSLINPPSTCPSCQTRIRWFDNIPLLSWVALGAKCRKCKAKISARYFIVELLTAAIFTGIFWFFFDSSLRYGVKISEGGLYLYLVTIIFISCLIASSGIDLELWIIPLSICWAGAVVGFIGSTAAPLFINPMVIRGYHLFPMATANTGAIAVGAFIGMLISLGILNLGWIKRSYEFDEGKELSPELIQQEYHDENISHRKEVLKEIVFLLPIILFSIGCYLAVNRIEGLRSWWINVMQVPAIAGLIGSLYGYFVGCAVVWTTRILGTLVFGKEAMGLGDVHLMGAAGAVIGPVLTTVAFFIAPFYGLGWAVFQLIFKKIRQIPYGPFLSLAILTVIILHDYIYGYICALFNG